MIRTRIAPSPTGEDIHIGNLYTALLNWAVARKNNGQFIVRIEDTDRTRYVEGAEEKILSTLKAYGLKYDEGPDAGGEYAPYRQSHRYETYKTYAEELVEKGAAYYSFCPANELAELRKLEKKEFRNALRDPARAAFAKKDAEKRIASEEYVIRLLVPEDETVSFHDVIRGEISFHTSEVDDQVLLKSDGYPTYHLAVVVDDHLMQVSHVIRAEDWISSTPKHVLLYQAFGWEMPVYAHNPLLRNPNKSKLSKRKNPVWATWYLEQGFLPDALLNYLALMGWSHPEQKEIFSLDEFVSLFKLEDVEPVGPAFDSVKLEWMNGVYIRALSTEELTSQLETYYRNQGTKLDATLLEKTVPLAQERIKKLSDYMPLCEFFYATPKTYDVDLSQYTELLGHIRQKLSSLVDWSADTIGEAMLACAQEHDVKNKIFFQVLRVAISGKKISPPLNESMEILGKEECVERVEKAIRL
jgi:glutamyl-tRNA synthetase